MESNLLVDRDLLLNGMNNYQKGNTSVIVSLIVVVVVIGLAVYGLSRNGGNSNTTKTRQTTIERTISTQNTMDNNNVDSSAPQAKAGDVLIVNYTGKLAGGAVFDSNVDPKFGHVEPFKFILGAGYVIKGWDEGLVGMKVGEKRTLTIPPELGYGDVDNGPIPANSTLVFDIELLSIE